MVYSHLISVKMRLKCKWLELSTSICRQLKQKSISSEMLLNYSVQSRLGHTGQLFLLLCDIGQRF